LKSGRVMVTGGCGFIGAHLVELLAKNNLEAISIDHRKRAVKTADTIRDVVGDVRDRSLMSEIFSTGTFDCIFDLAAVSTIGLESLEYRRNIQQTIIQRNLYFANRVVFRLLTWIMLRSMPTVKQR